MIQTNTYAANYLKLQRYGLEDSVKEINSAAVRNAKKAARQTGLCSWVPSAVTAELSRVLLSIEEIKTKLP